jgi:predicted nucleic-acid-binding Zn-ribbon protein
MTTSKKQKSCPPCPGTEYKKSFKISTVAGILNNFLSIQLSLTNTKTSKNSLYTVESLQAHSDNIGGSTVLVLIYPITAEVLPSVTPEMGLEGSASI